MLYYFNVRLFGNTLIDVALVPVALVIVVRFKFKCCTMKFIFSMTLTSTYFGKNNTLNSKSTPSDVKSYHEFCTV